MNNTIVSLLIFFFIVWYKPKIYQTLKEYNDEIPSISSYSIMVRNLPKTAKKEEVVNYFVNLLKYPVVKVNFTY